MEDTRLVHCPGNCDFEKGCEPVMNEKYELVGACGYVITSEDKQRLLNSAHGLLKNMS